MSKPFSNTKLLENVLRLKPDATSDDVRRIAPALANTPDAELRDWMNQARRRLGLAKISPP